MLDRLRFGILSTGNIAHQFATGLRASRRCTISAVGSRDRSKAEAFAAQYHIPFACGSYEEVLRSADVDAVYNALPNSQHCNWTIAALLAGKDVLCEKPLATNATEAEQMFDAAANTGKVLIEAFMYRSHPQTLAALDAVRSGAIGQLKLIRTSFCFRTQRIDGNIRFNRELAGGSLMDIGCYCIDFSRLFAGGEPVNIDVIGHLHESGVDDLACGMMSFPNGIQASFTCGMTVQADNTAYLCGSEGYLEIPVPWKPRKENAGYTICRGTPPRMDAKGKTEESAPPRQWRPVVVDGELYGMEADDFAATVLDEQPPRISREDSLANMRILDLMRKRIGVV